MAKRIIESGGCEALEKRAKAKANAPKKLSKAGAWMRAHPEGILEIVNMRAVMK